MACFDMITCSTDQLFERINCNFSLGYIKYICNPVNTCKRTDGLYDCCTSNISECIIQSIIYEKLPTIAPTIKIHIDSACENICNEALSTNKCYWFEDQNQEVSCINKNNDYCCSHNRSECCQTFIDSLYYIFGTFLFVLFCCIYYKYFVYTYTRVKPENKVTEYEKNVDTLKV